MPVLERDPWRLQYFEHVPCPEHVAIPTDDPDCWLLSPAHRWIYDKLKVAPGQSQSGALAAYLLEEAQVAAVPGGEFGEDNCLRFSYATSRERIATGLTRIKAALEKLG